MRLIDADALIEEYDRVHVGEPGGARKLMMDAPTIKPEPQWIPCSERLPDNDEAVLISHSQGVTKAWWNGRFWTSIAVKKYKTVKAWMPLPEPWKGDTRE